MNTTEIVTTIVVAFIGAISPIIVEYIRRRANKGGVLVPSGWKYHKPSNWKWILTLTAIGGLVGYILGSSMTSIVTPNGLPTPSERIGKPVGNSESFLIYPNYDPSGYMGDIGDITVKKDPAVVGFIYEICGRGDHEWDYKYINGELNPNPAKFAGVMYLNPPNNWGMESDGGFDLRGFRSIKWEARSLQEEVNVEFIIGGITWIWDDDNKMRQSALYPGSMPRDSLGIYTLNKNWQEFQVNLSDHPEDDFQYVVGGFSWVIDWGSNQVDLDNPGTCPEQPKTFTIEIRNIRYERREQ